MQNYSVISKRICVVSPKFYTARKNFTGPPVPTVPTNFKSARPLTKSLWRHIMSTSREGLLKIILENPNEQLTSGCGRRECFYLVLMAPLKAIALMPLSLAPTYPLILLEQNTKSAVANQSCFQTVATTPKIHVTTFDKYRKHIRQINVTTMKNTCNNNRPLSSSGRILRAQ